MPLGSLTHSHLPFAVDTASTTPGYYETPRCSVLGPFSGMRLLKDVSALTGEEAALAVVSLGLSLSVLVAVAVEVILTVH